MVEDLVSETSLQKEVKHDEEKNKENSEGIEESGSLNDKELSEAQRDRVERNRRRARELREARQQTSTQIKKPRGFVDTGGGFLLEDDEDEGRGQIHTVAPHAPLVHSSEQPHCMLCQKPFPQSYLFDTFDYSVCDQCRDDEGKHSLITRTEAKSEFLLKDCDLDLREPPLRCVRRPNPHKARFAEMRLYLRAQVEERALVVWGSEEQLSVEKIARDERRQRAANTAARRRLRALRMDVRSSLFERTRASHTHEYGPERPHKGDQDDLYERTCACGHVEIYEKM
ncbi:unnamed protein product [Leptosia nina]|uniref:XPA C-terminal domain-containing protein n=1 Tax=Leptosia nina TaxID=320188 RepID=A0AAV1J4B6_9NEOP